MLRIIPKVHNNFHHTNNVIKCSTIIRCTSVKAKNVNETYTPVYFFPMIRIAGIMNKLKLYHTVFSSIAIPATYTASFYDILNSEIAGVVTAIGLSGMMTLYIFGLIPNKLIGYIYLSETGHNAKIAYLNFWGTRKDIIVPVRDLVPLSDLPESNTDKLYYKLRRYSVPGILKLNLKAGKVLDKEKFNKIFLI